MTCASHAQVITGIIQENLIYLSIKMTMPHRSEAQFVDEWVFQNREVCGQVFPSFPFPTPSFHLFALAPFFGCPKCEKLILAAQILFALYGNACYAGYTYMYPLHLHVHVTTREGYKLEAKSTPATSTCRFKARHNFTFLKKMDTPKKHDQTKCS